MALACRSDRAPLRTGELSVADFTVPVGVPGHPAAVRVYIDEERGEAARYAAEAGGVVIQLPLPPPTGYALSRMGP